MTRQLSLFPTITPEVAARYIGQARAEPNAIAGRLRQRAIELGRIEGALALRQVRDAVHISEALRKLADTPPQSSAFWKGMRLDD